MITRYLVATDGSDNALRAAHYAAELMLNNPNMKVTIIYVRSPFSALRKFTPWVSMDDIDVELQKMAQRAIDKTKEVFYAQGLPVDTAIEMGEDPGYVISQYAKTNKIGHIIMGTRGLSNLSGIIMGSVSHQVLHQSEVPVIFVK